MIDNSIIQKAVEWHLQLNSASASEADFASFTAWQQQDPAHALAYSRIESMWGKFGEVEPNAARLSLESALKTDKSIKKIAQRGKGIVLSVMALILVCSFLQTQTANIWLAKNKTAIGEQRSIMLADGSKLILNTNTALDVDFNDAQRLIKLYQGEVLITVAKDNSRPLIIATTHGTARALGTQFNVKVDDLNTQVAVVESKVEACPNPSLFSLSKTNTCIHLRTNQGANIDANQIHLISHIDSASIAGWATGTLAIDNQPLNLVLAELQRYSQSQIEFNQDEASKMRVSGVLPLNNIEQSLSLLADKLPIQIRKPQDHVIVVVTKSN